MAMSKIVLTAVLAMAIGTGTAGGKTVYVDTKGNDNADGLSRATAFRTINKSIDASANGDTIEVNEGRYTEKLVFCNDDYRYAGPEMLRYVKSKDPNDFNVVAATIIDGNGASIVVRLCMLTTTQLNGLTITGGDIGIRTEQGAIPLIRNCIIRNNNKAGIMVYQSTTNITNCIIHDNGVVGILTLSAWCAAKNCLIYDNNEGIEIGGSMTTGTFLNNTIVNNKSFGIKRIGDPKQIMSISNCIIWDNNEDLADCNATYSCIKNKSDANGTDNITSDPCFVNPRKKDFHISPKSPCVNAGDSNGEYTDQVDIDGEPRVIGGRVDIGADEVNMPASEAGRK